VKENPTVGFWLDKYLTALEADDNIDPNTVVNTRWALSKWAPIRHKLLRELTT
jgi:hypothetical protein